HQAVVAADLIHERDGNFVLAGDARQHVAAEFAFADPERRGGDIEDKISTLANKRFHRINGVEALGPELLVVPGILADGERHSVAAEGEELLTLRGGEVAHFVENVIGGQEYFRL